MPKIPFSNMTAESFAIGLQALDLTQAQLACKLTIAQPTVSMYLNGRQQIPEKIARWMDMLVTTALVKLNVQLPAGPDNFEAKAARLNTVTNSIRQDRIAAGASTALSYPNEGRLLRRQTLDPLAPPNAKPYRVRSQYALVLVEALRSHYRDVHAMNKDPRFQTLAHKTDYKIEVGTITRLMADIPQEVRGGKACAYNLTIGELEWCTIATALGAVRSRNQKANSLLSHWRKHKHCGYPCVRGETSRNMAAAPRSLSPMSFRAGLSDKDIQETLSGILAPTEPKPGTDETN